MQQVSRIKINAQQVPRTKSACKEVPSTKSVSRGGKSMYKFHEEKNQHALNS